ncbi:MAG: SDR family NAD(P)-dependent oxidoreductase [Candidatus Nanopelagicales bacterium]|nr:SDR family NAD(P)-dependent oxidoreductase [Candidatus Nanopelagicales bacterium]
MSRGAAAADLRDARVLVTGAAGGIGAASCRLLARARAHVTGADLDAALVAPSCDERVALDVTDDAMVARVVGGVGPLDGLVLSHGVTSLGPAVDTPMAAVDRVLAVNLRGAIAVTQAALPGLLERGGRIVVLSSVSGFAPLVHRTAYAASKHGIHGYFDSLRAELVGTGVSVTIVAPSFVATGIEQRATYRASGPAGEWSTAGEVLGADDVAAALVDGMARRRALVLPSRTARAAYVLSRVSPRGYARTMRRRVLGDG